MVEVERAQTLPHVAAGSPGLPLPNPCFLCLKAGFQRTYPWGCAVKTCISGAWHVQALSGYWFTFYR